MCRTRCVQEGARAKAGLNQAILDKAWGEIRRQLAYKCQRYWSRQVLVDPAYTSQKCSCCGHTENADFNAARNILAAGLAVTNGGPPVATCGAMLQSGGRRNRKPAA